MDGLEDARLLSEWLALGWSREIEAGTTLARRALGRDVVLWRASDGELHCWLDLCIHRGAKLSLGFVDKQIPSGNESQKSKDESNGANTGNSRFPEAMTEGTANAKTQEAELRLGDRVAHVGDCLVCPYHGWRYAGSGQCVSIPAHPGLTPPAKAKATTYLVQERYGVIWVCFGETPQVMPAFPIAEEAGFRVMLAGPYRFRALGPRLIENLLDVAHLGVVHAGLLGDPERGEVEDYEVSSGAHGPEATEIRIWQPNPDGLGQGALVTYHYFVLGPLTAGFVKLGRDAAGAERLAFLAQVMPVDQEFSEMRMVIALNYGEEALDAELIAFQDRVVEQDRTVVESQRPELLPLDLQAELHLRSDRMAIAYRRWLKEIEFSYGVV